jgi:hypothetical protein
VPRKPGITGKRTNRRLGPRLQSRGRLLLVEEGCWVGRRDVSYRAGEREGGGQHRGEDDGSEHERILGGGW